ncbi:MAG TPA: YicC/YloC family endoribonuclease [Terriglobia bacterium]|nr:YicC/YloC family endoribonuclease [Terriglobia bacterium]HKT10694.1 YicC/YloC family endoribonuclease [Terriglobia bacterium]
MVRSMTGYSKLRREEDGFSLNVSVKSVNHRFLDLQFRMPSVLSPMEPGLRQIVKQHVIRGHVEVGVNMEKVGAEELKVDRNLLKAYIKVCREVRDEMGVAAETDVVQLLRIPGVLSNETELSEKELAAIRKVLEATLTGALETLNTMREREGAALEKDIRERLDHLETLRKSVAKHSRRIPQYAQQRLENRLRELQGAVHVDAARLAQEVAYLASRSDISEELTRFQSHLVQTRQLLSESPEVGKKLDFLLQELNREANTLLSKTSDVPEVGSEVGRQAIEMKSEIEKLREQVQNIE